MLLICIFDIPNLAQHYACNLFFPFLLPLKSLRRLPDWTTTKCSIYINYTWYCLDFPTVNPLWSHYLLKDYDLIQRTKCHPLQIIWPPHRLYWLFRVPSFFPLVYKESVVFSVYFSQTISFHCTFSAICCAYRIYVYNTYYPPIENICYILFKVPLTASFEMQTAALE